MSCNVCSDGVSKYKCPSCRIPYCSVPCWKTHKSAGCASTTETTAQSLSVPTTSVSQQKPSYNFPTEDTVPLEKLKLLDESQQLKNILSNPHVQAILSSLDKTSNPRKMLHDAMQEPIFVEFVDECMRIIDPPSQVEIDEAMMQM